MSSHVNGTYGNGTNSSAGANTITHFYDRAGVKAANRVNLYGQFADRKSMPQKMGKTFKISKFLHLYDRTLDNNEFSAKGFLSARSIRAITSELDTNAGLAEGAGAVNKVTITKVTMECSQARYGEMIDYTDEVELFSEDSMQVRYREELGELANSRQEDLLQRDMLATGTVIYGGTATSMSTVDGTSGITYDLMRTCVRKLVRNRAKKNTTVVTGDVKIGTQPIAKAYYAIIGAAVKGDLETITRGADGTLEFAYVASHKYASAATLADGEVGAMHEVRFIESESAVIYDGQGAVVATNYTGGMSFTLDGDNTDTITAAEAVANFPESLFTVAVATAAVDISAITLVGTYAFGTQLMPIATHTNILGADLVALSAHANATYTPVVGLGRFDVFPILFPTEGAFATVGLKGKSKIKFNSKSPEKVENSNPYGTTGFFSYNFFYAGIILQEEKLLKVLVSAPA